MKDPSVPGRIKHAVGGMLPITSQATTPESAALGFVGLPIYGHTEQEKRIERRQREIERRRKRKDKQKERKR